MKEIKDFEPFFGSWTLGELIGEGSTSKVYKIHSGNEVAALCATHIFFPESVMASKKASRQYVQQRTDEVKRLFDFAKTCFAGHPNIVQYQECDVASDDRSAYVFERMELLEPLEHRIREKGLMESDVVKIGIDIANALTACHSKGLLHRDVKPGNILCDTDAYKLGDFNTSTDQAAQDKTGSYPTIAPEVMNGENYDFRADIYSLGMTLYLLLNKMDTPFSSYAEESAAQRACGRQIPRIKGVDPELMKIIRKACSFHPDDRFRTATAFRNALKKVTLQEDRMVLAPSDLTDKKKPPKTTIGGLLFRDTIPPLDVTFQSPRKTGAPTVPHGEEEPGEHDDPEGLFTPFSPHIDVSLPTDMDYSFPPSEGKESSQEDTISGFSTKETQKPDLLADNKNVVSWACFTFILGVIPIVFYTLCQFFLRNSDLKRTVVMHEIVFFTITMLANTIKTILFGKGRKKHRNIFFLLGATAALLLLVAYGLFVVIIVTEVVEGLELQTNLLYCSIPVCIASIVMGYYTEHMEDRA